jgi:hypothetical protein
LRQKLQPVKERQITSHLLMVRPAHFGYNPETAANNAFQSLNPDLTSDQVEEKALQEFDTFVARLRDAGVQVHVVEDTTMPVKPDAIFPNNWVTFHQDGTVATYPMHAPTRRKERREDVIEQLSAHFEVRNRVKFEGTENEDRFLEGTGSLILDRPNRIAYACLSPRTEGALLESFCDKMGYDKVAFTAVDGDGKAIYHTNVMMALGVDFVVICLEAVPDKEEQQLLKDRFAATGKAIIEISLDQMMAFAGNMLQVAGKDGTPYLVMSEQAYQSLTPAQVELISQYTQILNSPLYTIEQHGGGSARCMMAEIFLEEK